MNARARKRWGAPMAFAAAVLLGVSSSMDALADGVMVNRARDQELQRQLVHAALLMMLSRPHQRVGYTASGGGGGGATHFGFGPDTADITAPVHTYTPSNSHTAGHVFSPTTPAELNTVLTGGSLGGFTLAAGDTIVLARGTCYNNGTYTRHIFPYVSGAESNPILVITSGTASIAAPGERILASQRHATPHFRCQSNNLECVLIDGANRAGRTCARGYRFVGIQADAGSVTSMYGIVRVGPFSDVGTYSSGTTYAAGALTYSGFYSLQNGNVGHAQVEGAWWSKMVATDLPDDIIFDRCDFVATAHSNNCVISLYAHHRELQTHGCLLWTEGGAGLEDKAFLSVTSVGPALFDNTQFTACAINMLTGGGDPMFVTYPKNFHFKRCWFYKPTRFLANHADWDGLNRIEKNSFEFKVMDGAIIEDCLFENHIDGGTSQYFFFVLKTSNQDGGFPEAETKNITVRYNRFKNVGGGFALGTVDLYAGGSAVSALHHVSIYHNYTETPFGSLSTAGARSWSVQMGIQASYIPDSIHFEHNTLVGDYTRVDSRTMVIVEALLPTNLIWRNNVSDFGDTSLGGFNSDALTYRGTDCFTGTGSDIDACVLYTPGASIPSGKYNNPPVVRSTVEDDIYVDRTAGDYHTAAALTGTGYEGRTPGADIDEVDTRTAGCDTGIW